MKRITQRTLLHLIIFFSVHILPNGWEENNWEMLILIYVYKMEDQNRRHCSTIALLLSFTIFQYTYYRIDGKIISGSFFLIIIYVSVSDSRYLRHCSTVTLLILFLYLSLYILRNRLSGRYFLYMSTNVQRNKRMYGIKLTAIFKSCITQIGIITFDSHPRPHWCKTEEVEVYNKQP